MIWGNKNMFFYCINCYCIWMYLVVWLLKQNFCWIFTELLFVISPISLLPQALCDCQVLLVTLSLPLPLLSSSPTHPFSTVTQKLLPQLQLKLVFFHKVGHSCSTLTNDSRDRLPRQKSMNPSQQWGGRSKWICVFSKVCFVCQHEDRYSCLPANTVHLNWHIVCCGRDSYIFSIFVSKIEFSGGVLEKLIMMQLGPENATVNDVLPTPFHSLPYQQKHRI